MSAPTRRALLLLPALLVGGLLLLLLCRETKEERAPVHESTPVAAAVAEEGASLAGRVLAASGALVEGAEVLCLSGERVAARVSSGSGGGWLAGGLPEGEYLCLARAGDRVAHPLGPIPVGAGERLEGLDLILEAGALVSGTVRDGASGEAIADAAIELSWPAAGRLAATRSDRAGRFRLDGLLPGEVSLRVAAAGYEPRAEPLALRGRTTGLEIFLRRGAAVRGRVIDASGAGARATVRAVPYRLGGERPTAAVAESGGDGRFAIDVPAGAMELEAWTTDGRRGRSPPFELPPGGERTEVEIVLEPPADLAVAVLDPAGAPAAGARVEAVAVHGAQLAAGTTGADGRLTFAALPPGPLRLVARRDGASGVSPPVEPGAVEVTVRLGAGVLAGRVVDPEGRGLGGARVRVFAEGMPSFAVAATRTDREGTFRLAGPGEGPLRVEAEVEGRSAEARSVFPGADELRLVIGQGQLVGRVLVDRRPATDFIVSAIPLEAGRTGGATRRFLGEDGAFRLALPPGRYEVRAAAERAGRVRAVVEVPGRGDSEELLLELTEGTAVEGVVLEAESGEPVTGARVAVEAIGTFAFSHAGEVPGEPRTLTGIDGRFRLGGLPAAGQVPIFVWKPGYRRTRPRMVEAGTRERIEIRLEREEAGGESAFGGVGLTLGRRMDDGLMVRQVIEGGPGWQAGVRPGDWVVAVDGMAVRGADLEAASERIRGPVGTAVVLDLVRDGTWFRVAPVRAELRF